MRKKHFFLFVLILLAFLRLLDSVKSRMFVESLTGYSSGFFLTLLFTLVIAIRLFGKILYSQKIVKFLIGIGAFFVLTMFFLAILNASIGENYIYGLTQVHIDQLFNLGLFLSFVGVMSLPSKFFKKNYKLLIFSLGLLLPALYYMYGYFPLDARHQIAKEDNLIENFQFMFLVLSSVYSFFLARFFYKKNRFFAGIFVLAALGFLFVAGDEISWGQRILGIETPSSIAKSNAQNEITVHNNYALHGYTPYMFVVVAFYGAFMWIMKIIIPKFFKKHKYLSLLIPSGIFFPYFFISFAYNFYTELGDHTIGDWSEPTEFMLYLGVFLYLFVFYNTRTQK